MKKKYMVSFEKNIVTPFINYNHSICKYVQNIPYTTSKVRERRRRRRLDVVSDDYDDQMIPGDECDPNFLTFVLQLKKNSAKISTRKLTPPGI